MGQGRITHRVRVMDAFVVEVRVRVMVGVRVGVIFRVRLKVMVGVRVCRAECGVMS